MSSKIQTRANKGEWSEFYAHLKILCDKVIPKGDQDLEPDANVKYPIVRILKKNFNYFLDQKKDLVTLKNNLTLSDETMEIPPIRSKLASIFDSILASKGSSFTIDDGLYLSLYLQLPITNSQRIKSDIDLEIIDPQTITSQILGFSIKSKVTAESTLVNASLQTRFCYKLENISPKIVKRFNSIHGKSKIRDRVELLQDKSVHIISCGCKSVEFQNNLKNFDSIFDVILGQMLLSAYFDKIIQAIDARGKKSTKRKSVKDLKTILQSNIFKSYLASTNFDLEIFTTKLKDFLLAFTLGMEPVKRWSGIDDLNGGIIWVKNDGSLVCHHLFERKELKEYLINNTFFETPSTSRHQFGMIYEIDNQFYFDLCLQIRFK